MADKYATKIGKGLARFQSFADDLMKAGFRGLKNIGNKKEKKKVEEESLKGTVVKGLKKTASFLGETGKTFYDEYEDIKAKKKKK